MKRGRPIMRQEVQSLIIEVLGDVDIPMSINAICGKILNRTKRKISWNTVHKYLGELVEFDKIKKIPLPHSKTEGKEGLTVYILKK